MTNFTWDPDAGRFRDESGAFVSGREVLRRGTLTQDDHGTRLDGSFVPRDALPTGPETITTQSGEVVSANEALREGRVTKDEHGFRVDGRFVSKEALVQEATVRGPIGEQEEAERLVITRPDGTVTLIRAGGSTTPTDTAEEVVASGISSAALKEGIISVDEYQRLGRERAARVVREMAVIRQDLTKRSAPVIE